MTITHFMTKIIKSNSLLRNTIHCKQCIFQINNKVSYSSKAVKPLYDINTNVVNDVILFKYENPKFFRYMNIFAVVQYTFWTYLGYFAYSTLRDVPIDESKIDSSTPLFRKINLGDSKFRRTLAAFAVIIGVGSIGLAWMYTLRSVRYLILNKGGKDITFVTYAPFGNNTIMKVPLDCVSCKSTRADAGVQLPLKVKNKYMHYILDMRGEFKNGTLFDYTAGLHRQL